MKKQIILSATAAIVIMTRTALGNDSSAELAAGGLVFTKNLNVEMQSEDLYLSAKEVRVRYRFFNKSDSDVVTTVAFPMPDIPLDENGNIVEGFSDAVQFPNDDLQNFLGFTTKADGGVVKTQVEQKTVKDAQTISYWRKMVLGGAHGVRKTTYYWKQTFPAHQETIIEHRYTPIVSRGIPIQDEEMRKYQLKEQKRYQQKYCMDKDSLDARIRIGATEHALEYILTTGANWSGPIRDFRLVIDKGAADNIVQFCMREPIKKIRPTQFEVHVHNFLPTSNLRILFILPPNQTQREMDGSNAKIDTGLPPSQAEPTRGGNEPPTPQRLDTSGQRTSIGKCRGFAREHAYQLLDAAWRSLRLIRPKRPRIGGVSSG